MAETVPQAYICAGWCLCGLNFPGRVIWEVIISNLIGKREEEEEKSSSIWLEKGKGSLEKGGKSISMP